MSIFSTIEKPTLLLDETAARRNIARIAAKARQAQVRFRPHFKTHQSIQIGEWFRPYDVTAITVSSVDMASYFADAGWQDIVIAFPVNLLQIKSINSLAKKIHLGLLIESSEAASFLGDHLDSLVDIWIKIDVGNHRTGMPWERPDAVLSLAKVVQETPYLNLRGILTHAGQTYAAKTPTDVKRIYQETVDHMNTIRSFLEESQVGPVEISVGDTPSASLCEDFGLVDEIRPGNFVLYDAQQLKVGSCSPEDIACAVACPVVARHPERNEIVVYGGAIHLSKDTIQVGDQRAFGLVSIPQGERWADPLPGAFIRVLSQEHGVLHLQPGNFEHLRVGDLACLIPAHSCLTVQLMRRFLTLNGEWISTMNE